VRGAVTDRALLVNRNKKTHFGRRGTVRSPARTYSHCTMSMSLSFSTWRQLSRGSRMLANRQAKEGFRGITMSLWTLGSAWTVPFAHKGARTATRQRSPHRGSGHHMQRLAGVRVRGTLRSRDAGRSNSFQPLVAWWLIRALLQ